MLKMRRKSQLAESLNGSRYLSQRVVGCVEDQDLGARCELAGQFCGIQLPIITGSQLPLRSRALQEEVGGAAVFTFLTSAHLPSHLFPSFFSQLWTSPLSSQFRGLPSLVYVPGVPQPTHAHPGSLASLCLHITTQHSLPASGTETQGDLQPSLSWVRNNQKQAL